MTSPKNALLLVGSAKPAGQSTSEALGSYLAQKLAERDIAVTTMHVARAMRTEERTAALLAAVDAADIVILAFPLYVDGLPYLVTQALEQIAAHRAGETDIRRPLFLAIANCGFPEVRHNDTALGDLRAVCRRGWFALGRWAGAGRGRGDQRAAAGQGWRHGPQRRSRIGPGRGGAGGGQARARRSGRAHGAAFHPRTSLHADGRSRLADAGAAQPRLDPAGRAAVRAGIGGAVIAHSACETSCAGQGSVCSVLPTPCRAARRRSIRPPHHILPESGWVSFYLREPADVARAIESAAAVVRSGDEAESAAMSRAGAAAAQMRRCCQRPCRKRSVISSACTPMPITSPHQMPFTPQPK